MAQVKGIWTFKDEISPLADRVIVNFTSKNKSFLGFECVDDYAPVYELVYINETTGSVVGMTDVYFFEKNDNYNIDVGWTEDIYKTIDFGETEQTVSDEFYNWLTENTVKKTVKGTYIFKDELTPATFKSQEVTFVSVGSANRYYRIYVGNFKTGDVLYYVYQYYDDKTNQYKDGYDTVYNYPNSVSLPVGWSEAWSEKIKTIDFGEEPQEVSADFYAWLMENAAKSIEINIVKNGTTTLATAGKYCDRNIDVNVNVDTDVFWDRFQNYGNRTFYEYAFAYTNFEQLHPKYKVVPTASRTLSMFQDITGVKVIEKAYFDLSNCTVSQSSSAGGHYRTFYNSSGVPATLEVIEDIGIQAGYYYNTFYSQTNLHTIEVLRVVEETQFFAMLNKCPNLQNITIVGTIGQNGFRVTDCKKLTKESILSILQALSLDITETKTITFSTAHQSIIEADTDCKPYWETAKEAGWSFVYE